VAARWVVGRCAIVQFRVIDCGRESGAERIMASLLPVDLTIDQIKDVSNSSRELCIFS
jgi:hypothetical protein